MERTKAEPYVIEIHPNEKMPVFRPHNDRSKITTTKTVIGKKSEKNEKTERPRKSWFGEVQGFMRIGLMECSRLAENRQRITTDVARGAATDM